MKIISSFVTFVTLHVVNQFERYISWWQIVKDKIMAWEILARRKVGFQLFHHSPNYRLIAAFMMIPYRMKSHTQ